jgi:hypothetical protein
LPKLDAAAEKDVIMSGPVSAIRTAPPPNTTSARTMNPTILVAISSGSARLPTRMGRTSRGWSWLRAERWA